MLLNHINNLELDIAVVNGCNGMNKFSKNKKTKAEQYGMKMTFLIPIYSYDCNFIDFVFKLISGGKHELACRDVKPP